MAVALSSTPMLSAHDEPALVVATRAGDNRAFEALYARYRERIFAFILSRVHDHGRAEDIAQDVFISALRRLRAGDQEIAFKPWIYEIAKNACIDEFRRGSRSREVLLDLDADPSGERPAVPSAVPTPAAAVESKQRMDDLRGAFGGLSDTHHRLLVLREFEGLSYDEIGERLDMNRQMVESGLFRARRKLTEEYQDLASGRRCEQVQLAIGAGSLASARALGLRDRRRFARHLSHCQPCRHVALLAGVDQALVRPRSIPAKIAALLPFPLARLRWPGGHRRGGIRPASPGSHQLTAAAVQNAPALTEQAGGPALALVPAAVAAAALAIAGVGGGLLRNAIASGHAGHPAAASRTPAVRGPVHSGGGSPASSTALSGAQPAHLGAGGIGGLTRAPSAPGAAPGASRGGSGATPSSSGSRTGGTPGHVPALSGTAAAATAPVRQVISGVASATQQVVSTTQRVVAGAGGTVGKLTGSVTSTASKTVQGGAKTVQGAANTVQGTANSLQQATTPATSSTSVPASGATSAVSSATQGVAQTAGQATQTVGQTVQGLLP